MKRMRITLTGENAELVEQLCAATGLTPPNLIALLLRKGGKDLESWLGMPVSLSPPPSSVSASPQVPPPPPPSPPSRTAANNSRSERSDAPADLGTRLPPINL
ncbi:MAG: hypothetical protein HC925_06335 [Coleofasciculaceae cyanobacterium SM2_3_26]|nr:hypothetical protein [Coleofasciculaceae cyanobacterium SM2_3_26]